jgi:hypothetical protein
LWSRRPEATDLSGRFYGEFGNSCNQMVDRESQHAERVGINYE